MSDLIIREAASDDDVLEELIRLSIDWEAENSCYGYRANDKADIEGNRIFIAKDGGGVIGYLFGHVEKSGNMRSIMPEGTPYFEVEELYVVPERRSKGVGAKLFRYTENAVKADAEYMVLSTATKNRKAIFHFYIDELEMEFWSARLFKRIR
ncbi:MAG: GNAT family N-acetyltransferase [Clostridia bacterium]|nr:GNAT family N-acetyltransferase [Clostridia bacterium]